MSDTGEENDYGLSAADAATTADRPKRHRRTKAEMEAVRANGESGATVTNLFPPMGKAPKPKPKKNLEAIRNSLMAMHTFAALKFNMPALMLSEDEAHLLAESGANLLEYYKIEVGGKTGAALGLIYAIGIIYGPRAVTVFMNRKNVVQPSNTSEHQPSTSNSFDTQGMGYGETNLSG